MSNTSNVLHLKFGPDRDWDEARKLALDGLLKAAHVYGDDEKLMRAKAERATELLREIAECDIGMPPAFELPPDLRPEQLIAIRTAFVAFAGSAIVATKLEAMQRVTDALMDLCTSKLCDRRER